MNAGGPVPYTLYILDLSYFSGKMQCYLRYKEIPHDTEEISWWYWANTIYPRTGLMKVPVIRTEEGQWLQDSSPMIEWFEQRHPAGAVLPEDEYMAFFCHLLEDYADEWLWRPALYYRWAPAVDARLYGERFAREFLFAVPGMRWANKWLAIARQRHIYVRGDGITAENRAHVESIYRRTLEQLEAVLERTPFLLGERPCLADFGFFASMFRHFSRDPTPAKIMLEHAPRVYAWVARMWAARHSAIAGGWPEALPESWDAILDEVANRYLPYLHANARAWRDGRKRFDYEVEGYRYPGLPTVQYRVWCRERLQERFEALSPAVRGRVRAKLDDHGALEPLLRDGRIESRLHTAGPPPVCRPGHITWLDRLLHLLTGTSWNEATWRKD